MKLKEFGNDIFKVLDYMKTVEVVHGNEKIIVHTQQEMANDLHMSKLKVNQLISQLFYFKLLRYYTQKGKYQITEAGYEVIRLMNTEIQTGGM